jgi:hypothetical protein
MRKVGAGRVKKMGGPLQLGGQMRGKDLRRLFIFKRGIIMIMTNFKKERN